MTAYSEVELELSREISFILRKFGRGILPEGYQCDVEFRGKNRKKRKDAEFESNWNPDVDSIWIGFSFSGRGIEIEGRQEVPPSKTGSAEAVEDRLSDLVRALNRAENRPGYEFVSLKWFRDSALAQEGFTWAADEYARHDTLREAIDRRWVLTSKIANPRPPNFPVTAIRLNRQMPEIKALLGGRGGSLLGFRPVPIRGESLSTTVLRDRR